MYSVGVDESERKKCMPLTVPPLPVIQLTVGKKRLEKPVGVKFLKSYYFFIQ